jgi:peptidoglycan/LPS O-acetylase OafA/YrhL
VVSYLLLLILSPKPEEFIPWYRPVKYMRYFLSMKVWIPIANLTYSIYLFHFFVIQKLGPTIIKIVLGDRPIDYTICNGTSSETANMFFWNMFLSFVITTSISIVVYVLIEKQGINARIVFKNRFQIEEEKNQKAKDEEKTGKIN